MLLEDLISKPNSELTSEELEVKIKALRSLNFKTGKTPATPKSKSAPKGKSNKDKQIDNAIKKMSPEQKAKMKELMGL